MQLQYAFKYVEAETLELHEKEAEIKERKEEVKKSILAAILHAAFASFQTKCNRSYGKHMRNSGSNHIIIM
jgi:hypothetical protein